MKKMLLFLLTAFTGVNGNAQKITAADTASLAFEINGILVLDGKEVEGYSYCLHHGGEKMDSAFVKKMKTFEIHLKRNEIYTLSYHKDGYLDKYMVIDTHVPKGKAKKEYYELKYEIELNPAKSKHKEEYKDHPVAVIKYLKAQDEFDFSTKYHTEIHNKSKSSGGSGK